MKTLLAAITMAVFASSAEAQNTDEKLAIMLDAARQLSFTSDQNRAFLLVKLTFVRSPVAVVFGYIDNEDACNEIARDLAVAAATRATGEAARYDCDAIY